MVHLLAVSSFDVCWPLQIIPHHLKPRYVFSYKCRWQLRLSLFFQPLDNAADALQFFEGCHAVSIDSFGASI
jgi:hypothetical protein